ncbi:MAG: HAD-IC family P-type ATPase [Clostridia bacterium]|nr:HAD-IC family P-type ATPase [Clostridia bacterium]
MTKEVKKELTTIAVLFALLIVVAIIPAKGFLNFLLYLIPFALSGFEIFKALTEDIMNKRIKLKNNNLQITVITLLAFIIGKYFDAVVVILLIRLSDIFKNWAIKKVTATSGVPSQESKAKIEGFVVRLSKIFTPALLVLSALVLVIGLIVDISAWREAIHRSIICLAISYPSALTVSVPLAFASGIGKAKKSGIAVNGACFMESLSRCDTVVLEKSGVLTDNTLVIKAINPEKTGEEQLLEIACLALTNSNDPIALSVRKVAKGTIEKSLLTKAQEIDGLGILASMTGKIIAVGNEKLMEKLGIEFAEAHYNDAIVVYVALGSTYLGNIVMQESVKENADKALYRLKSGGVKSIVMLTEDKMSDAARIAEVLPAIDEFHPSLTLQDKASIIEQLVEGQEKNEALVYVGNGKADASLRDLADVGIVLGDADGDVVIPDGAIEKVPLAVNLAEETLLTAKENIVGALAVKLVVLILGVTGVAGLTFAIFADLGITALAILNSMRIIFKK